MLASPLRAYRVTGAISSTVAAGPSDVLDPGSEGVGGLHGGAGGMHAVDEPEVGGDDADLSGHQLGGDPADDLVVGRVAPRAGRVGDLDDGRANRRSRWLLEHDD